jgi:hypothetical protein
VTPTFFGSRGKSWSPVLFSNMLQYNGLVVAWVCVWVVYVCGWFFVYPGYGCRFWLFAFALVFGLVFVFLFVVEALFFPCFLWFVVGVAVWLVWFFAYHCSSPLMRRRQCAFLFWLCVGFAKHFALSCLWVRRSSGAGPRAGCTHRMSCCGGEEASECVAAALFGVFFARTVYFRLC